MTRGLMLTAAALGALSLAACNRTAADDKAFGDRVHAYILAHPEVIQEAAQKLQEKEAGAANVALANAVKDLPKYRAAIERDPRDYVANPAGKYTVTEFYDYRCPHCANAAPRVLALIHDNPDVRFVFKEMPIFGATSEHAARAALAVKKDGGDYLGVYQAFMTARPLDDDAIDRIAQQKGAKALTLISGDEADAANAQIADVTKLFNQLALGGTPAFIVGDQIIPGEDVDAVREEINKLRGRGAAPAA